jgi:hypothetical protein
MARSPGFGSDGWYYHRLIKVAFARVYYHAPTIILLTHNTKGTLSSHIELESMAVVIPAAYGATSSGFSPVYYLLFQHSLTVLCTIGQWNILSFDDGTPFLP